MRVVLGTDHAGFELKEKLIAFIESLGHEVVDKGAYSHDSTDDYPEFISQVAREVMEDSSDSQDTRGIILGGSGQGEAITANRYSGVRAIVYMGPVQAVDGPSLEGETVVSLGRLHNDANILSLGARFVKEEDAFEAVRVFLETPFSNEERHVRRIALIEEVARNSKASHDSGGCGTRKCCRK